MKYVMLFSIVCLLSVFKDIHAQEITSAGADTSKLKEYVVAPVIVTATRSETSLYRVPRAVDVLNNRRYRQGTKSISLDEALAAVPGVFVNNRYNIAQGDRITIRGIGSRAQFGVRGIKLFLDDIPLTMSDGQAQLNNVDLGSVGEIEILRGPSSSLYGNASGGVISLKTESNQNAAFQVEPSVITGAYGYRKWQGKVQGRKNALNYIINLNRTTIEGFRDYSSGEFSSANAVVQYRISNKTRINALLNIYDAPYLLNPSSLDKNIATSNPRNTRSFIIQQGSGKEISQSQTGITIDHTLDNANSIKSTLYGVFRDTKNNIPGRVIDLNRKAGGFRFAYNRQSPTIPLRLTAGLDYEFQNDGRKEYNNLGLPDVSISDEDRVRGVQRGEMKIDQDENVKGIGPFVELEYGLLHNFLVTAGGRYDYYNFEVADHFTNSDPDDSGDRSMDQFSPAFGILYQPSLFLNIFSNYSTAFQTPTTTELGNRASGEGGFNPDLKPEIIKNYEIGVKGLLTDFNVLYDITVYFSNLKNMLIPFQIPDPLSEEVYFRNAGSSNNKGIEMKLNYFPTPWFNFTLTYTHTDFTFDDFNKELQLDNVFVNHQVSGNKVPGVAPNRVFTEISLRHPEDRFFGEIAASWVDYFFANDFNGPGPGSSGPGNEFINDAYLKTDVRAGIKIRKGRSALNFFFGLENIFNTRYNSSIVPNAFGKRFFEPGIGRNLYFGIKTPFTIQ